MPTKFTLQIDATETPPGWSAQWFRDDRKIGDPIPVQDQAARDMADLSGRFLELFEQGGRPQVDREELRAIGRGLFATWFEPAWSAVVSDGDEPGPRDLVVSSADRRVLNLPWELVELAPDLPVGCDAAWSLRRSPMRRQSSAQGPLRPGPLRILFLAAAPIDLAQLDYEREEEAMPRATARLPGVAVQYHRRSGDIRVRGRARSLVPALRDGEKTFAAITGIGGAGKSTLATRAASGRCWNRSRSQNETPTVWRLCFGQRGNLVGTVEDRRGPPRACSQVAGTRSESERARLAPVRHDRPPQGELRGAA